MSRQTSLNEHMILAVIITHKPSIAVSFTHDHRCILEPKVKIIMIVVVNTKFIQQERRGVMTVWSYPTALSISHYLKTKSRS